MTPVLPFLPPEMSTWSTGFAAYNGNGKNSAISDGGLEGKFFIQISLIVYWLLENLLRLERNGGKTLECSLYLHLIHDCFNQKLIHTNLQTLEVIKAFLEEPRRVKNSWHRLQINSHKFFPVSLCRWILFIHPLNLELDMWLALANETWINDKNVFVLRI